MSEFSLKKQERLCSRKAIGTLFSEGEAFFVYPIKVVYLKMPLLSSYPVQVAFSVSKKNFKRAVKRNLLKRRMREAYRVNKNGLYEALGGKGQLAVMFIYSVKEAKDFELITKSMNKALGKLIGLVQ